MLTPERLAELAAQCDQWAESHAQLMRKFGTLVTPARDEANLAEYRELAAYLRASVPREVAEQMARCLEWSIASRPIGRDAAWMEEALDRFAPYRTPAEPKEL